MAAQDTGGRGTHAPPHLSLQEIGSSPNWMRLLQDLTEKFRARQHINAQRATEGLSPIDAVCDVVVEMMEEWRGLREHDPDLEAPPHAETNEEACERVLRKLARRKARAHSHVTIVENVALSLAPTDLLDAICARDEVRVFFTRLFKSLEDQPEARLLLSSITLLGIPYKNNQTLARVLGCSVPQVVNMKKRIKGRAVSIMKSLLRDGGVR